MHALDMAPTTAALCLLARALAAGNAVRRLNLSLLGVRAESSLAVPAGHAAESEARLIGRVIQELKRTVAVNTSLRCAAPLGFHSQGCPAKQIFDEMHVPSAS